MSKVRTNDGYKDIEAVYAGNIPIDTIYDKNGNILFSAYNEVNGISPLSFKSKSNNSSTLKNYRIYGNTVSSESVGDKTENLFDIDGLVDGALSPYDGKTIIYNGQKHTESYISVSGDSYYTLSGVDNSLRIHQYKSDYTFIKSDIVNNDSNFVTDSQTTYIRFAGAVAEFIQPMLNSGSTALPYEPYGYRVPVKVEGKNLCPSILDWDEGYINYADGVLKSQTPSKEKTSPFIQVEPDDVFLFSYDVGENDKWAAIAYYDSDQHFISGSSQITTDLFSINISDQNCKYIKISCNTFDTDISPMLNSGSSPLPYEPYYAPTTTNLYLPEQLKKVDDVYEYIDYAEQKQHFADGTSTAVTLPELNSLAGTNVLTVETEVQPSDIYLKGKIEKKPKIYYYSDDRQTLLYTESVLKGEDGTYSSPPEKTNYIFLGWQPKAININKNQNCYSVFVEQNENEAILVMYAINGFYNNRNAIDFVFKHSVPADKYDIVKIGIHYGTNKLAGADTTINGYDKVDLTVNGAAYGVNDVETVLRTGGGKVKNAVATYTSHSGKFSLSYALGNNVDSYALAVGYIQAIEKATGNEITFYSNLISTTYNKCSQLCTVTFYNDATLLKTGKAAYGDNIIYSGEIPTKASTQQYDYNFLGWNTNPSALTADANALANVTSDRTVYAIFAQTTRTYTVTFYNESTVLETVYNVPYGGAATYTGATPTSSQAGYIFSGWSPSNTNITADTSCYAQFVDEDMYESISDTWSEIIANVSNGTYSTKYQVGDTKKIDLGTEGEVIMTIVGIDADDLADNSGKAPITWISKQLLKTSHRMNPQKQSGTSGTGTLGGWEACEMRSYLINTIKPLMPSEVRNALKTVKKYSKIYNTSETAVNNVVSNDDIWIPSVYEVNLTGFDTSGITYSTAFPDNASRIKHKVGGSAAWWWLRSAYGTYYFSAVNGDGSDGSNGASLSYGVAVGFCT